MGAACCIDSPIQQQQQHPPGPAQHKQSEFEKSASAIGDNFDSFETLALALRDNGLESCNLIVGIDVTKSNLESGTKTFGGRSLHWFPPPDYASDLADKSSMKASSFNLYDPNVNPYRKAISFVGAALESFDEDGLIPAYYFGDLKTKSVAVQSFTPGNPEGCRGFPALLAAYESKITELTMSGPTSFEPMIEEAIRIVQQKRDFHILLIIADGQVSNVDRDAMAIYRASAFPISIIVVGVGDGPWDTMKNFDDHIRGRKFDNFQFVPFEEVCQKTRHCVNPSAEFALHCLMEVPEQYKRIKALGLIQ